MYLLYTENVISQYKTKITKASVPHLKVVDLLKVKISIPSIQEQKRIIKAAETFTATQDLLISNLMHEIENRKKQYEYYRDKLLTF
jgi:type I restriction enzyme S subunit